MSFLKIPISPADHHLGTINAAITVVEYGDYQCPHCKRAYPLIKRLLTEMGEAIHFVFRNFPLKQMHPLAFNAALAAEAAGLQGKFWEMHDIIFENQNKITAHFLMLLAGDIGVDAATWENDMRKEAIRNKVTNDFRGGIMSGVNGTPSFFINGRLLQQYDETYESLRNAVIG